MVFVCRPCGICNIPDRGHYKDLSVLAPSLDSSKVDRAHELRGNPL